MSVAAGCGTMEASSIAARPASVSRRWRRLRRTRRQAVFDQIYSSHKENSSLDGVLRIVLGSVTKSKATRRWSVVNLDEAALNSVLVWLVPANHVTHKVKFATLVLAVSWSLYRCCCSSPTPLGLPPPKQNLHLHLHLLLIGLHISGLLMMGRWYHRNVFRNQGKPWMDPAVVGWNRRPMHALLRYHTDEQTARETAVRPGATMSQKPTTQNILNLDGDAWEFRLERTVEDALDVVLSPDLMEVQYDSSSGTGTDNPAHMGSDGYWHKMDVPSNWTCRNFDRPIYTNVKYPFPCVPPYIPLQNPAGIYRRLISLPEDWNRTDSQYSLILHGVESCAFVFWNEILVGFSKDSRLPSEFDVTSALFQKGKTHNTCTYQPHLLQVVVPRFSDGSYLEDQDHWWMAGLHRSVELVKKPKNASLIDYTVEADMDGRFKVEVSIECAANERNKEGELLLIAKLHEDGHSNLTGTGGRLIRGETTFSQSVVISKVHCTPTCEAYADIQEYRLEGNITNPRLWSAEIPNLYTLTLTLVDHDGTCRQIESCRVGFRTVDISGGTLRINRRRITICGVNHHEHDPDNGKVVSFESMRRDVELLKQNNFNAVRLSHYPHASSFYDLCDYYGLYVCDESNIETHGMMPMGKLAQDWAWRKAFLSRVTRCVQRDRNYACIIIWSLGNESGKGRNLTAARDLLRNMDSTRPIAYEGGGALFEGTGISDLTDIVCPMYPTVDRTVDLGTRNDEGRPVILCEYSHAMGNSNGNLDEYWKHFWDKDKPRLQGGFIWDMIDQGLRRVNQNTGKEYFSYGDTCYGDINDRQFCINGLYSPDRVPHPAVAEVKYLQQPVKFTLDSETSSGVTLGVTNRYSFQSTDKLKWTWFVTSCDKMNEERTEGLFSFSAPHDSSRTLARINLDSDGPDSAFRRGERCWLTIQGSLLDDVSWAREGHIVVKEQIELNYREGRNERSAILDEAMAKVGVQTIEIQNDTESKLVTVFLCNMEERSNLATLDASTGALLSYNTPQGYSVLDIDEDTGMQPNVTRASTDNDKGGFDLIVQILVPKWVSWILQPLIYISWRLGSFTSLSLEQMQP